MVPKEKVVRNGEVCLAGNKVVQLLGIAPVSRQDTPGFQAFREEPGGSPEEEPVWGSGCTSRC